MPVKSIAAATPKTSYKPLIVLGIFVLLAVGGLAAWTIYQGQQVSVDKARFAQAEHDIDDLSKQVIATVGTPVKTDSEKYCSRPNTELNDGPLSCDIKWTGYYEVASPDQATTIYQSVRKTFTYKWANAAYASLDTDSTDAFRALDPGSKKYDGDYLRILGNVTLSNKIKCRNWNAFYLGTNSYFKDLYTSNSSRYILAVELGCGDNAKIEHYPLKS